MTESDFYRENDGEKPDNDGEIKVWDAATGKCVEEYRRTLGAVRLVSCDSDATSVLFEADLYSGGDGGK